MLYRKAIRLEIMKRGIGMSSGFWQIRNWRVWRGQPSPKSKKRKIVHGIRAGYVGVPATP
jgi:hypothetical protein